jgi:hypothetical protein
MISLLALNAESPRRAEVWTAQFAHLLVAAKVTTRDSLSPAAADEPLEAVTKVAASTQGRRIL